jgi:hypothetical protein
MKFRDLDRMSYFRFTHHRPRTDWFRAGDGACPAFRVGLRTFFGPWVLINPDAACESIDMPGGDGKVIKELMASLKSCGQDALQEYWPKE